MTDTRDRKKRNGWIAFAAILILIALLALAALDQRIGTTEYTVSFPTLPAGWDGVRIALVADTHGNGMTDGETELLQALRNACPDYIFCLGDMLNENEPDFDGFLSAMKAFAGIAPTYMVSGNHDRWTEWEGSYFAYYRKFTNLCSQAGVVMLEDTSVLLRRGEDEMRLIGFADPEFWSSGEEGSMSKTVESLPGSDGFDILLFHRANLFPQLAGQGYELVCSGHLHGGVVRIPFVGPLMRRLRVGEMTYAGGVYELSGTVLVSSRGLGNNTAVPRVFNRPELVIMTLKREGERP